MTNWTLIRCLLILSVFEWICQEVNQTRIKVYYPMSSYSKNSFNSYDYLSQDMSPFRIGVFCHKCGKDDFRGNTRSLSSHVRYCKSKKTTTQSNPMAWCRYKIVFIFGQETKDPPESVHLVVPKLKEGLIVRNCCRPSRYVPYKGTFVPYDGTFGASD
jgi:hypothetical protein